MPVPKRPRSARGTAARRPSPRPRRRVGVDGQRATLLAAALRALATKPYEHLSVEDVLREAQVSRQTFYRCFPNKQALFHRIFRDGNALFLGALGALDKSGDDPVTVADRALTGALSFVVHGGPALRALYRETIRPDGEFAPYRAEVFEAVVADIVGWARVDLELEVDELLVRAVLLAVERLMFELAELGTPSAKQVERFRRMVHVLVDGLWRGLRAAGAR